MKLDDKKRIAARLFYQDNEDQYEDYHEALCEFSSGQNMSDAFIDTVIKFNLEPESGHKFVMRDDGHVAKVRLSDWFFSPVTKFSEEEGDELVNKWEEVLEGKDEMDTFEILKLMGWRVIEPHSKESE